MELYIRSFSCGLFICFDDWLNNSAVMEGGEAYERRRMALLPSLHKQDPDTGAEGHYASKLPVVLSEMQAGNAGKRQTIEYDGDKRA